LKSETPQGPPTSLKCGKWKRWSYCYKRLNAAPIFFTLPLPTNFLLLPFLPPVTSIFNFQLKVFSTTSMAKSDSKKRAELMAREWKKSRSSTRSLNDLVGMGLLHNQELGGWRAPEGESYPDPRAGEIVIFEDFFKRGFGIPVHPFL